ncbi:MAG: glycosyltransferase family 2 protein [Thermoanaerobaculia bacterium]|nr:glycosyltransferase family 2 protein [Thermoanaerobaculia bacterium]
MRDDVIAVLPAYDCEGSVGPVVAGLRRHLSTVIVVDDGSRDDTAREAREAGAVVESFSENRGKGRALRRGMEEALERDPEALLLLDADGQHDPEDSPRLLQAWDRDRPDIVIGARLDDPEAIPSVRYWTNYIGSRILSWMTGLELLDSQSGYRLVSAELLRELSLESDGYAIESEMLIKAAHRGARIVHVPVKTIYRSEVSHYRPLRDTVRISCRAIYFKAFDEP